jgi:hypothetical protein
MPHSHPSCNQKTHNILTYWRSLYLVCICRFSLSFFVFHLNVYMFPLFGSRIELPRFGVKIVGLRVMLFQASMAVQLSPEESSRATREIPECSARLGCWRVLGRDGFDMEAETYGWSILVNMKLWTLPSRGFSTLRKRCPLRVQEGKDLTEYRTEYAYRRRIGS